MTAAGVGEVPSRGNPGRTSVAMGVRARWRGELVNPLAMSGCPVTPRLRRRGGTVALLALLASVLIGGRG